MRILLTNDDGINAPGINILKAHLLKLGHKVLVVAPDVEKSASSHSITLNNPLRIIEIAKDSYAVTGSPADSVILALQVINKEKIDVVISGINRGPNLGDDVLYSGTVAAAIEGMYFGLPAIAVSLCSKIIDQYDTAASYIGIMLENGIIETIREREILNINVPAIKMNQVRGIKVTHTGHRVYKNFVFEQQDPGGNKIYWLGGDKPEWIDDSESDYYATQNQYISITPLSPNLVSHKSFEHLKSWITDNETVFSYVYNSS